MQNAKMWKCENAKKKRCENAKCNVQNGRPSNWKWFEQGQKCIKQRCENAKVQKCKTLSNQIENWLITGVGSDAAWMVALHVHNSLCYVLTMHCTVHTHALPKYNLWMEKNGSEDCWGAGWMQVGLPGAAPDAVGDAAHRRPLLSHRTRGLWCSSVIMPDMPGWECGAAMPWTRK